MAKMTFQFSDKATRTLDELAEEIGTTKTDVLRRALALFNYVEHEVGADKDKRLSITDVNGTALKDIVLH